MNIAVSDQYFKSGGVGALPKPKVGKLQLAFDYWVNPSRFVRHCSQLGDRFQLPMPGMATTVGLTHPNDIKKIFAGDQTALHFGEALGKFAPHPVLFGQDSLASKDDEPHLSERRRLNPHFGPGASKAFEPVFERKTREAMQAWPIGEPFSFHEAMMDLTLDIIIEVVMGVSNADRANRLRGAILEVLKVAGGAGFLVSTIVAVARGGKWDGGYRALRAAMQRADDIVMEEIAERRAVTAKGGETTKDVLAVFLQMQENDAENTTDDYILNTLRLLLIGGYETTASTLGWLGERLTRTPNVVAALECAADEDDVEYLNAVVNEVLRSRPILPFTGRLVVKPIDMGDGLVLQPGMMVLPIIIAVHNRADVFDHPEAFMPERFLSRKITNYELTTFGGGVRRCLGAPFAQAEMRIIMQTICKEFHFENLNTPEEPIKRRNITFVPGHGGIVKLSHRSK